MPGITALLHTHNDALRLGRALEILYACDELLIVDHASGDHTVHIAREYGASVIEAQLKDSANLYHESAQHPWILCLDPHESVSESLVATLLEWKLQPDSLPQDSAFSVQLREETAQGWTAHTTPHTRLVPRNWTRWHGMFPLHEPSAPILEGEILRFAFP
jgi:glycosyltransferase involved in cell wall biosynthesis